MLSSIVVISANYVGGRLVIYTKALRGYMFLVTSHGLFWG